MQTQLQTVPGGCGCLFTGRTFGGFIFYCFQVAARVCPRGVWGGAGAQVSAAEAAAPPRVGAPTFPAVPGAEPPTTNTSEVSLLGAPANPGSARRVGWEGAQRKPGTAPRHKRILRIRRVSARRPSTERAHRTLASDISTFRVKKQPFRSAERCFKSWGEAQRFGVPGCAQRVSSLEGGIAGKKKNRNLSFVTKNLKSCLVQTGSVHILIQN